MAISDTCTDVSCRKNYASSLSSSSNKILTIPPNNVFFPGRLRSRKSQVKGKIINIDSRHLSRVTRLRNMDVFTCNLQLETALQKIDCAMEFGQDTGKNRHQTATHKLHAACKQQCLHPTNENSKFQHSLSLFTTWYQPHQQSIKVFVIACANCTAHFHF
jgi:hypothetical protein